MTAVNWAKEHDACEDAVEWLATLPAGVTLADAWDTCRRSDWMLWALEEAGLCDDSFALHEFACYVAEGALRTAGDPDPRSVNAILVKRRWLQGEASDAARGAARVAAWDAARDAAWGAARDAAWVAARVAAWGAARDAAWDAARDAARGAAWVAARVAAWDAAWVAARDAAWVAARDAAWVAARDAAWDTQADLLRRLLGNPFTGEETP